MKMKLQHRFVEFVPEEKEDGILYISMEHGTAIHKCVCGCGNDVVTPLSPVGWQLTYDGEAISLNPSIGNWYFPCQTHYWIKENKVIFARRWDKEEINKLQKTETIKRKFFFQKKEKTNKKKKDKKD